MTSPFTSDANAKPYRSALLLSGEKSTGTMSFLKMRITPPIHFVVMDDG
jgi:hypothetical protein